MVGLGSSIGNTHRTQNDVKERQAAAQKLRRFLDAAADQQMTFRKDAVPAGFSGVGTEEDKSFLPGREINGIREKGHRVVVRLDGAHVRFVVSPLFSSKRDARKWAKSMGGF